MARTWSRHCTACGEQLLDGVETCPYCGTPVTYGERYIADDEFDINSDEWKEIVDDPYGDWRKSNSDRYGNLNRDVQTDPITGEPAFEMRDRPYRSEDPRDWYDARPSAKPAPSSGPKYKPFSEYNPINKSSSGTGGYSSMASSTKAGQKKGGCGGCLVVIVIIMIVYYLWLHS